MVGPCLRIMLGFDMFDLKMMHYFLGIEIVQSAIGIFLCLSKEICARNLRQVWDEDYNLVTPLAKKKIKA